MVTDIPCSSGKKNNKSGWRKGEYILGRISQLQIHKQLTLQYQILKKVLVAHIKQPLVTGENSGWKVIRIWKLLNATLTSAG